MMSNFYTDHEETDQPTEYLANLGSLSIIINKFIYSKLLLQN